MGCKCGILYRGVLKMSYNYLMNPRSTLNGLVVKLHWPVYQARPANLKTGQIFP